MSEKFVSKKIIKYNNSHNNNLIVYDQDEICIYDAGIPCDHICVSCQFGLKSNDNDNNNDDEKEIII
jgi:hypothetical protein